MESNQIDFIMYILGFVGLLVLLSGAFSFYEFKYGLIGAIVVWFIAGASRGYYGIFKNR